MTLLIYIYIFYNWKTVILRHHILCFQITWQKLMNGGKYCIQSEILAVALNQNLIN